MRQVGSSGIKAPVYLWKRKGILENFEGRTRGDKVWI